MDRRVLFFTGAAAVCVLLVPVAPPDFRWLCWVVAAVYLVLAAASGLDSWSRNRTVRSSHPSFRHDRSSLLDDDHPQPPASAEHRS